MSTAAQLAPNSDEVQVEMKTIKLSKSKIKQMDYIGFLRNADTEVLGWVNLDGKRAVIVKRLGCYYRAEYITEIESKKESVQFALENDGWEFPHLTVVKYRVSNGSLIGFTTNRDDAKNVELHERLVSYKSQVETAGQIYY